MAPAGLFPSIMAAIQASLSVLLVMSYGAIAAKTDLLSQAHAKTISKLCVQMFLPLLLLTKIGAQIRPDSAGEYAVVLLWAFVCHFASFVIGSTARRWFGLPKWVTVACMFNNTTAYPLLLIESLDASGILQHLVVVDETTQQAIDRMRSYFLVFATVSNCLTFAVGPRLVQADESDQTKNPRIEDVESAGSHGTKRGADKYNGPTEQTALLSNSDCTPSASFSRLLSLHLSSLFSILKFFINPPLIGAILGTTIGLVPFLKTAFFAPVDEGGIFSAWLTISWRNVGAIFVPLPLVVAGVSLYTAHTRSRESGEGPSMPWKAVSFVVAVRLLVWPMVSINVVHWLATRTSLLGDDPMLWFAMSLMPAGPPAMKLITMVQVSAADEGSEHMIAKLLTISYIVSPILAFTVVGALRSTESIISSAL